MDYAAQVCFTSSGLQGDLWHMETVSFLMASASPEVADRCRRNTALEAAVRM
jgi:hypothetical protein